jgi:hypothetical protein
MAAFAAMTKKTETTEPVILSKYEECKALPLNFDVMAAKAAIHETAGLPMSEPLAQPQL